MDKTTIQELNELLLEKNSRKIRAKLLDLNPADIAEYIEMLGPIEALVVFRLLPKDDATETFAFLPIESQEHIISSVADSEATEIVERLFIDDAVDMLEELPANVVKRIMANVNPDRRKIINEFLKYPEDSVGSIMTSEYISLKKEMTVGEAIAKIRNQGFDKETIYTCYIIDSERHLEGFVSVRTLLLSKDSEKLANLQDESVIYLTTTDDQEDAARLFAKYGFLSMPVVDKERRLVGIVTVDDIVDVMEQEATEDFEKMAAMAPSEKPYLKTSVLELAKNRIVWLLFLMVSATITGTILGSYEAAFVQIPLLVTFIPMLTDTGGNAGSQSSTMVIRGLATGEIEPNEFLQVLKKELGVSIIVGIILAAVNFLRIIIIHPQEYMVALVVSLAMILTVIMAKAIGGLLPIAAKKLKLDPAIMAAPLITTIVDTLSLILYFQIAKIFLPL